MMPPHDFRPEEGFEPGDLSPGEIFWRDHYKFLKKHGYTLRDRYNPDRVPSWKKQKNVSKSLADLEDGQYSRHGQILDAARSDGTLVVLKDVSIDTKDHEILVGNYFFSGVLAMHSKNHCVPFLEVIDPPEGSQTAFIVMPYLLETNYPSFQTIGEVVDYFRQIFEGLQFMHENNVVHGDCKTDNFMAGTVSLFNVPPHPAQRLMRLDYQGQVSVSSSHTKRPVKYYLIDFDLSGFYRPEDVPHLRQPPWGGDKSVPEFFLPNAPPCDPFAVDVYCMGNSIRQDYLDGRGTLRKAKKSFEFMRELVNDMTNSNPRKRPSMTDVVSRFEDIVNGLDDKQLRSPVLNIDENLPIFRKIKHWTIQWTYKILGIPAIPNV
ncbi:hypothetical protein C0989_006026 [Termitomyces sp. Mn162]|nr:hypothetical protein C0989_006026 [Termitomyces sp. Mn162]